jgi:hypothetical protein
MVSFCIRAVDSRNNVSFGASLWKTTLEIDDFPLLSSAHQSIRLRFASLRLDAAQVDSPSLAHQQQTRLSLLQRGACCIDRSQRTSLYRSIALLVKKLKF